LKGKVGWNAGGGIRGNDLAHARGRFDSGGGRGMGTKRQAEGESEKGRPSVGKVGLWSEGIFCT